MAKSSKVDSTELSKGMVKYLKIPNLPKCQFGCLVTSLNFVSLVNNHKFQYLYLEIFKIIFK